MTRYAGVVGMSVGLCLVLAGPVHAEADDADEAPSRDAEAGKPRVPKPQVVTVEESPPYIPSTNTILTHLPASLFWIPANLGTVNEPVMRDQFDLVLTDALRNVSGINVQTQTGVADLFLIRGFDSLSGALVLTDGAAEPEVTYYQMYNVERVEVYKGPTGFLYGTNPLAGTVNIVRRQPQAGNFGRAAVSAGSFNTFQGTVDWNAANQDGDLAFRLNGLWRQSDFYRDDKQSETWAVNPSFTWRPDDVSSLNLNLELGKAEYQPDSGLPLLAEGSLPEVPRARSYQSPFDFSDQDIGRVQVDYERRLNEAWTLRNKTYVRSLDWRSNGTIITGLNTGGPPPADPLCNPFFIPTPDQVCRSLSLLDDQQDLFGNRFEAALSGATGSVQHDLLLGLEISRFTDRFTLDQASLNPIDLFDPVETTTSVSPSPFQAGDVQSDVVAPYAIDQITFSKKWQVMAGARWDSIDFQGDRTSLNLFAPPGTVRVDDISRSDSKLSPMLGVVFAPTAHLSVYGNAAESFAPPSPRAIGSPEPEQSRQLELGLKTKHMDGKITSTIAVYDLERDNIGIPDATGFLQETGDQRSRGVEVEFAAEPRPRLRAFLSYAYNDSELTSFRECAGGVSDPATGICPLGSVDQSGNTAPFAPKHLLNLWVSQRFQSRWGIAGEGAT